MLIYNKQLVKNKKTNQKVKEVQVNLMKKELKKEN